MTGREGHLSILHTWTLSLSIDLMCSVTNRVSCWDLDNSKPIRPVLENGIIPFQIMEYAYDFTRYFVQICGKVREEFQKLFTAIVTIKCVGGVVFGSLSADANG